MVIIRGTEPGESLSGPNREVLRCGYGTLISLQGGSNLGFLHLLRIQRRIQLLRRAGLFENTMQFV